MTNKKLSLSILTIIILFITFIVIQSRENCIPENDNYIPPNGYVPDEATAIKIAEAIWFPIYGKKNITRQKPYEVKLTNDSSIWVVQGTLPKNYIGGVAFIEIQKNDCKILKVTHGK